MEYTILNPDEATGGLICLGHIAEAMARHAATGFGKRNIHMPTLINLRKKTSALLVDAIGAGDIRVYHHDGRPVRELPCREDARSDDEYLFALATTKAALVAWGEARGDSFKIVDYEIEPTHSDLNQYGENGEVLRVLEKDHFRGYCFGHRYIDQESSQVQPSTVDDSSAQASPDSSPSGALKGVGETLLDWVGQCRLIALECISRHEAKNLFPSQSDVCQHVESVARDKKIYGRHGRPISASYIRRNAIGGEWWQKNKPSPTRGK